MHDQNIGFTEVMGKTPRNDYPARLGNKFLDGAFQTAEHFIL
jgi:hypothetical protein